MELAAAAVGSELDKTTPSKVVQDKNKTKSPMQKIDQFSISLPSK